MKLHKFAAITIGTLAVTFMSLAHQQEPKHAPTVEMCRANVAVWYSVESENEFTQAQLKWLRDGIPNRTEFAKLSIPELFARMYEMLDCSEADGQRHNQYFDAASFYNDIVADRTLRFVIRHGLMDQLKKEDAEGKR
jgi:hypothetical protein